MELKNIIAALLFILPGILSYKWVEYMSSYSQSDKDNLEKTILTLVYSFPSVIVSLLIISFITNYKISGLSDLTKTADDFSFLSLYSILILFTSFGTACMDLKIIRPISNFVFNFYRSSEGLSNLESVSIWGKITDSNITKIVFIASITDPNTGVWGILDSGSVPRDERREILLIGSDEIEKIKSELKSTDYTYIDVHNQTLIKAFDCTEEVIQKLNSAFNK
jgi:uncharacterized membrane protein YjjB (DUF3815 family)